MSELDPSIYVELLKQGDRVSFDQLVDVHQNLVYNTIISIVQQSQDAEDLTQEVFIQVFKSIHHFRGESKLSTWIYRIAVTKSLEWERKKKSKKAIHYFETLVGLSSSLEEISDFHHPGISLEQKENAAKLFKALKQLPENQRVAFVLIKAEGLSYQEVSEIMKKSIKSIEGLIHRAKENLRIILKNS